MTSVNHSFIEEIKSDHKGTLEKFYNEQKSGFMSWARSRFDCDQDTIVDVFQDAIVTLYHNIKEGKITGFETTPGAYLFGIARNLMLKRNLKDRRTTLTDDMSRETGEQLDYNIFDRIEDDHRRHLIAEGFRKLKDSCRDILTLFYYHNYSMESIMNRLEYGSVDTVKSRKNQCMNKLKQIIQSN